MSTGHDHLALRAVAAVMIFSDDPETSCAWWAELLGLAVRRDDQLHWLALPTGVELSFHPADDGKNPAGASTVVYWRVESFGDALRQVLARGGALHRGPLDVGDGRRIAQIRDPFGAVVGLEEARRT